MIGLIIVGLADLGGVVTGFEGEWLAEYDPHRAGQDKHGRPMIAHIVTTTDPKQAKGFHSMAEAVRELQREHGTRSDGRPSRPLTAFNVEFRRIPNEAEAT